MKKLFGVLVCMILLIGIFAVPAQAANATTNWAYGFTAYTNGTTLTNAGQFHPKQTSRNYIEVRHSVLNSTAGYTNRIYAFIKNANIYAGAKWQAPNGIYYSCTSNNLTHGASVTPGGRGNTDYATYQGLSTVQIEGQFRTH